MATKEAVAKPAPTVTEVGALRLELVFAIVTAAPPAGAVAERPIVQVVEAFWPILAGLQDNDDTPRGATRPRVVAEPPPFRVAVMVAF